ncbi:MAG: hypothetical protein K9M57_04365 [Phycisphaerae bacterium]|nr:hypothetical protein [Phycisphaerae bacterium]
MRKTITTLRIMTVLGLLTLLTIATPGNAQNPIPLPDQAVVINIPPNFSSDALQAANRQIDRAVKQGVKTLVFRFSGANRSFDSMWKLARRIDQLHNDNQIRTLAFIPDEARGMNLLAVMACKEIYADEFALIGQVLPAVSIRDQDKGQPPIDPQSVIKKMEIFAKAGGHDPLLARAMTEKRMILYKVTQSGQSKLVDQPGFEKLTAAGWKMAGTGPLAAADQMLLLDGRTAMELGLVNQLAASEEVLKKLLNLSTTPVKLTDESSTGVDMAEVPVDANSIIIAQDATTPETRTPKAVFITCSEMIDEGLLESIKRRTEEALSGGATYIIYEMDTYGGRVDSALSIHKYILHEVNKKAHTVAYVRTDAISAGALISVACEDIIMKENTKIGDCAPIQMGGTIEGVEREKIETVLRSYFGDAAKSNNYPVAIVKAMVTVKIEVWQVKNLQTGKNEYFQGDQLANLDSYVYDLLGKKRIDTDETLVTLDHEEATKYGLSRTVVKGLDKDAREAVLTFLEKRDDVAFPRPADYITTNWSEEMVRWITGPTISGILLMIAMLGIYAELNSPGIGLPGAVAVVALVILFGCKFTIGMANWWEIAMFVLGISLLIAEIFVIPGFGVAGIAGILLVLISLIAMMVANKPGENPLPVTEYDWNQFTNQLLAMIIGIGGFIIGAILISRYLPSIPMANKLILQPMAESVTDRTGFAPAPSAEITVQVGQEGIALSSLRPSGSAKFDAKRFNVVTRGSLIEANQKIKIVAIDGNSIVVAKA